MRERRGRRRGGEGECKAGKTTVSGGSIMGLMFFQPPALLHHCRGSDLSSPALSLYLHKLSPRPPQARNKNLAMGLGLGRVK